MGYFADSEKCKLDRCSEMNEPRTCAAVSACVGRRPFGKLRSSLSVTDRAVGADGGGGGGGGGGGWLTREF